MNTAFVKLIFCRFDFTCWGNTTFNFTCFRNDISVHVLSTIVCLKGGWKEIRGIWLQRNARLPLSRLTGFSNTEKRFFSMSSPNVFAGLVSSVLDWLGLVVIWSLFPSFYFIFILYQFFQKKFLKKIFPRSSIEKKFEDSFSLLITQKVTLSLHKLSTSEAVQVHQKDIL